VVAAAEGKAAAVVVAVAVGATGTGIAGGTKPLRYSHWYVT
jgi:hypothetical protein